MKEPPVTRFSPRRSCETLAERSVPPGTARRLSLERRPGHSQHARDGAGHHCRPHRPPDPKAKRTLSAAAVIGSKSSRDLLETLGIDPDLRIGVGQFLDQITFTRDPEYAFHHPLIRTVAYESQLKSDRAELHWRLAATIETRDPASAEENAALIAEHLESAGT